MAGLQAFAGTPPYDSELLGVFQPLLGWRGRAGLTLQRRATVDAIDTFALRNLASATAGAMTSGGQIAPTGNVVLDNLVANIAAAHPGRTELAAHEWQTALSPDLIESTVQNAVAGLPSLDPAVGVAVAAGSTAIQSYYRSTGAIVSAMVANQPESLNSLLLAPAAAETAFASHWMTSFPRLADAILSPIGLLHLFRQYFFELDSFLGPPVGHVWLSPGSSVEMYESTVRRRLVERVVESALEITQKSESTVETKEELSESVKQDNADDMKIAASASGGFNVGVAHGEASASFGLDQARRTASEQTHNRSRSQTEKKSSEIRQSFKTTFRTVSEETDTASKRYLLQNNTDALVNYELRRKMRRVGVQLHHLGTRLCWQYYVDLPSTGLRTSRLVHLAKLSDADMGLRPPEAPGKPDTYDEDHIASLAFQPTNYSAMQYWDETWVNGVDAGNAQKRIQWQWLSTFPPKTGYVLAAVTYVEALRANEPDHVFQLLEEPELDQIDGKAGSFRIQLHRVNWHSAHRIDVRLKLRFQADSDTQAEAKKQYDTKVREFEEGRARAYQEAFVGAVRDRVKAAGDVRPRPFEDLREEERHSIYRRLIDKLTHKGQAMSDKHVGAEIVRQLFDVDAILYFVAPDWWDPGARASAALNAVEPAPDKPAGLQASDLVDWGHNPNTVGDPYLVTEQSNPAPMGASIGWVLQLDGDRMRNAFLNAAWAKAVVPIRPGREREAIAWLRDQAEQDVGLGDAYQLQPGDPQEWAGKTLREILDLLITTVQEEHNAAMSVDPQASALPGEMVFEKGFDPLAGGVRFDAEALTVFDQWVEVLPTDQVVAVPYDLP